MDITTKIKSKIRNVKDFPKEGIVFKDITPILSDPGLCDEITGELANYWGAHSIDAIAAVESRGFFFGMLMAQRLHVPFIPVRKEGKLPSDTIAHSYALEYGMATVEIHQDSVEAGWNVLVHDDLLATGGTAVAAAELVQRLDGAVAGFSFLIDLTFLSGKDALTPYSPEIKSLISY